MSKIKFCSEKQRYTVTAHNDRFAVMFKPFNAKKTYLYTITDLERGVRGSVNLIFGFEEDIRTKEGAKKILNDLINGGISVSYRHHKYLELTELEVEQLKSL